MEKIRYRKEDELTISKNTWYRNYPKEWKIYRIKDYFSDISEKNNNSEEVLLSLYTEFGVKRTCDIENLRGNKSQTVIGYKRVKCGDIIVNKMLAWMGASGITQYDGVVSSAYSVYRPNNKDSHTKFFHYMFRDKIFAGECFKNGWGIMLMRWTTTPERFKSISIIVPTIEEQQKIANFLDIKIAQFDLIIAKKEMLITKLKEAKKSLISEVVTGKVRIVDGQLVPRNASEMKDSGIDEIGLIASDYRISKIKFYGDFKAGISKSADYFGKGYPFVNYPDVYKNEEIDSGSGLALISKKEQIDFSIKKGDVFFTRTSETIDDIGESCICKSDIFGGSYSGFIIRFRLRDKNEIAYDYLKHFFQNSNIKKWFARQLNIVTRASLSQDKLKELPLILPSYHEQKSIGEYLNCKIAQLDSSVAKTSLQIEKLKQAKQSLISESVTGKIDLRDWEIIEEGEL